MSQKILKTRRREGRERGYQMEMVLIGDRDRLMHFIITKTFMGPFVVRSS